MSIKIMTQVWSIKTDTPIQKLILLKLADNASDEGYCYPSIKKIASQCDCGLSTVRKHLSIFKERSWIKTKTRYNDNGIQTSNGYYIQTGQLLNNTLHDVETSLHQIDPPPPPDRSTPLHQIDPPPPPDRSKSSVNHQLESSVESKELCQAKMPDSNQVQNLFEFWLDKMGKQLGKCKFTPKRKKAVLARLKDGYSTSDIQQAIYNCAGSAWHNGQNDRNQPYNDIELICRSGENLERFRDMILDTGKSKLQQKNEETINSWLNKE
jgi:hypothetical protein